MSALLSPPTISSTSLLSEAADEQLARSLARSPNGQWPSKTPNPCPARRPELLKPPLSLFVCSTTHMTLHLLAPPPLSFSSECNASTPASCDFVKRSRTAASSADCSSTVPGLKKAHPGVSHLLPNSVSCPAPESSETSILYWPWWCRRRIARRHGEARPQSVTPPGRFRSDGSGGGHLD